MTEELYKISINITRSQKEKISKSGMTITNFIHNAIDSYDVTLGSQVQVTELQLISRIMSFLNSEKLKIISDNMNVLRQNTDIFQSNILAHTNTYENNTNNTEIIQENIEILPQNTEIIQNDNQQQKTTSIKNHEYYPRLKPYLQILSKQLNLNKKVSEDTKTMIKQRTGISIPKISMFVQDYYDEIKDIEFEINTESVKVSYDDAKKM